MITRQIRVWGRVQGVGFRFFTQQLAIQLDICGTVQNKMDGSVFVVAQGEEKAVTRFIERVKASVPLTDALIAMKKVKSMTHLYTQSFKLYKERCYFNETRVQ